ncbi:YfmQ family protein [Neobacillus sp. 114]|uniref:YfmQ family protein n=1 Tax=Neobacillus sp. 114 TaxID=3048535 RepID=UPI0024C2CC18|nr:YfmQ family protein [Neobacillus sp. 114]
MTWTAAVIIVIGVTFKLLMSPPSAVVGWVVSKFALHPQLDSKNITITFNGKYLEEVEKISLINYFNEANFLKKYPIFPGNEKLFLHPETNVIPFIINVKRKKKEVNLFLYCYNDRVDVVKQWKKKVASYSLSSEHLQKLTISNSIDV